jgi:UDP-N-acetylmuramate dehydrogenase
MTGDAQACLAAIVGDARLKVDEPLAPFTTMRVGGPADFLAVANSTAEVAALVRAAQKLGLPWRLIGRGSNLLVADAGIRGLVIRDTAARITVRPDGLTLRVEAGLSCAQLAGRTAKLGLTGMEFAVAIPGTVGGAVVQNAGAHGTEMVQVLTRVDYMGPDGRTGTFRVDELGMRYRWSRFKEPPRDKAVLSAEVRLERAEPDEVAARIAEIRTWRAASQPGEPSAGSIFTNPPGDYAGRLIEAAGLKGLQIGGAQISPRHANFIVNLGGARAADVAALIERARTTVAETFGIELEPEVERVGDW